MAAQRVLECQTPGAAAAGTWREAHLPDGFLILFVGGGEGLCGRRAVVPGQCPLQALDLVVQPLPRLPQRLQLLRQNSGLRAPNEGLGAANQVFGTPRMVPTGAQGSPLPETCSQRAHSPARAARLLDRPHLHKNACANGEGLPSTCPEALALL